MIKPLLAYKTFKNYFLSIWKVKKCIQIRKHLGLIKRMLQLYRDVELFMVMSYSLETYENTAI